jgi:hypothetical protein
MHPVAMQELCLLVREDTIHHILRILAHERYKTKALLTALEAIVMIEELDLPLKRNQTIIMKYLPQYRDQLFVVRWGAAVTVCARYIRFENARHCGRENHVNCTLLQSSMLLVSLICMQPTLPLNSSHSLYLSHSSPPSALSRSCWSGSGPRSGWRCCSAAT